MAAEIAGAAARCATENMRKRSETAAENIDEVSERQRVRTVCRSGV